MKYGDGGGRARAKKILRGCGYAAGGAVREDMAQDKKMIAGAIHKHDKQMHSGQGMTKLKDGGMVGGAKSKRRMDRPSRLRGGAGGGLGRLEKAGMV